MCACSHPFQNVVMWNSSLETNTLLTAHRFLAQKDVVNGQCLECLLNTPSVKELEPCFLCLDFVADILQVQRLNRRSWTND